MNKIYITGDTHGMNDIFKITTHGFPEGKELDANDYVIICGDVAVKWDGGSSDAYIQKWFDSKPWTTLFVDGNHENHTLLDDMPVTEMFGGRVHKISNHVIHLMRGEYYTIAGRTFFTFGGGESTDKIYRKEGISWWPRELPSAEEIEHARATMSEHNNTVDYIITHVAPTSIQVMVSEYDKPNVLSEFFDEVYNAMSFKRWYCGHYHRDFIIKDEDDDKTIQMMYCTLKHI